MTGTPVLPLVRCQTPACRRRAGAVVDGAPRCAPCGRAAQRTADAVDRAQAHWTAAQRRAAMTLVRDPDPALLPGPGGGYPSAEAS